MREWVAYDEQGGRGLKPPGDPVHIPAEVVDQQIAGEGRNPGLKASASQIERRKIAVHLDKDVLCQVLGVMRGAGKAIAKRIDAAVMCLDQLGPGERRPPPRAGHGSAGRPQRRARWAPNYEKNWKTELPVSSCWRPLNCPWYS